MRGVHRFHQITLTLFFICCLAFTVNAQTLFHSKPLSTEAAAGDMAQEGGMLQIGEELTYNVSYASIDIGQIRIKVLDKISVEGRNYYQAIAYIDSYSGIPFVDVHTIYESFIDEEVYSQWFRARVKDDSKWYTTTYEYNYPVGKMYIQQWWWGSTAIEVRDSVLVDTLYQDGLSLYYFARQNLMSSQTFVVPTLIQENKARTIINFMNKRASVEIDAVDYPIDVIEFEGEAEFVGVFGLTGTFQGWFSNDDARVPILAKMHVIIGSVRIELMKWNRQGWNPPRYVEETGG